MRFKNNIKITMIFILLISLLSACTKSTQEPTTWEPKCGSHVKAKDVNISTMESCDNFLPSDNMRDSDIALRKYLDQLPGDADILSIETTIRPNGCIWRTIITQTGDKHALQKD